MSDHSSRELARRVLATPLPPGDDSGAATLRGFFVRCMRELWEDDNTSGKRPLGSSGWRLDLTAALIRAGLVEGSFDEDGYLDVLTDEASDRADHLVHLALQELARP